MVSVQKQALMALDKEVRKVMAAQNIGMEEARGQVQSMQSTIASCWQAMAPEAFASLGLAPSEFESYLRSNAQVRLETVIHSFPFKLDKRNKSSYWHRLECLPGS